MCCRHLISWIVINKCWIKKCWHKGQRRVKEELKHKKKEGGTHWSVGIWYGYDTETSTLYGYVSTGLSFHVNACFASKHKMLDRKEAAPSDNHANTYLQHLIGRTPLVGSSFLDFIPVEHGGSFGDFLLRHVIPDSPHKLHKVARFQHHANE